MTGRTTAASGSTTLSYNNRNLPAQKINARGQVNAYEYDAAGRLISVANPDGTASYTYDQNGNLLTAADSTGTIEYLYDALNRPVKYKDIRGNIIEYAYDAAGNLSILTYPGGRQVNYQYNAANQLVQVTDWAGRVTAYEYDLNGRLVKTVNPNGTETTRTYDAIGRLLQLKNVDADGSIISQYEYTYDAAGNLIQEENSNEKVPFAMDDAAPTYAADNRLDTYNGQTVLYDADGNMTAGPLAGEMAGFTYDARGRLTGAGNTTYTYDAGNNRISVAGAVYRSFVVNPNASLSQVLVETDEQNHQTFYIYGLGLIGQEFTGGVYRSYHFDHRGSTIALTDESGNITDHFQYAPYGELVYRSGNTATPFLFTGRHGVMTDESDLYYMRARYYNPVAKRFLSPDTLIGQVTNPQSQNRYMYCEGNPANYIDPTGHGIFFSTPYGDAIDKCYGKDYGQLYEDRINVLNSMQNEIDIIYGDYKDDFAVHKARQELERLYASYLVINEYLIIKNECSSSDDISNAYILLAKLNSGEIIANSSDLLLIGLLHKPAASKLGKEGENAAGIINAKTRIPSLSNTAKYRIPDELLQDEKVLREIKNVSTQSYTRQLKDFNEWSKQNGYQFVLEVRPGAKLSGPLEEAINKGDIILKIIGN